MGGNPLLAEKQTDAMCRFARRGFILRAKST